MAKKKKKKNQIIKVNVTRLNQDLKAKLDEIDVNAGRDYYNGYYESRLRILILQWKKGKLIALHYRGVKCKNTNYPKLSRATGRDYRSLEKWHKLYLKHPKLTNYKLIAEENASIWTENNFKKMAALLEDEKAKQLPESKMKTHVKGIMSLLDDDYDYTDELEELRQFLNRIHRKGK